MFCSKCGKTLPPEGELCPACGHVIGQSRFEGSPYTSAQSHILPGDDVQTVTQTYTRTTYTSMGDAEVPGDVDTRTTYRPAYGGDSMPEDIHRDMRAAVSPETAKPAAASEAAPAADAESAAEQPEDLSHDAASALDAMDEELRMDALDLSKYRAQSIESSGQSGMSSDVSELIQQLQAEPGRKPSPARQRPAYDDYEAPAETASAAPAEDRDEDEVFEDIDEDEFEELRHSGFNLKQLAKILVVLIVASALIVGGLMWVNHIRDSHSSAPIENVREDLYNSAIQLMEKHSSNETTSGILSTFRANSNLAALSTTLQASSAEVTALLPENPTDNEKLLMQALRRIESDIANCITSDAIAISQNNTEAIAASDDRWAIVENSMAALKNAKSAAELTGIINGEPVSMVTAKPEATPTPPPVNYSTLSKGDKSDEVFDMQTRLWELGFLQDARDGAFGGKTQTAVKMFQQVAGLEITGIADAETLAALYAEDAPRTDLAQPTTSSGN